MMKRERGGLFLNRCGYAEAERRTSIRIKEGWNKCGPRRRHSIDDAAMDARCQNRCGKCRSQQRGSNIKGSYIETMEMAKDDQERTITMMVNAEMTSMKEAMKTANQESNQR